MSHHQEGMFPTAPVNRIAGLEAEIKALREDYTGALQDVEHLEAEVARLTRERDDALAKAIGRLTQLSLEEACCAQQRKDIRRLMELVGIALTWMPDNDQRRQLVALLAEIKERYGA